MGRAPDASCPEVAQVQVRGGVQPFALRRARQGHRLAEEGRHGDPALLWDGSVTSHFSQSRHFRTQMGVNIFAQSNALSLPPAT